MLLVFVGLLACGGERPDAVETEDAVAATKPRPDPIAECRRFNSCVPENPCHTGWVTGCRANDPICTDIGGWLDNGTTCGTTAVCYMGQCVPCAAGDSCVVRDPYQNEIACRAGAISCATGQAICQDAGIAADGRACTQGAYEAYVCKGGQCIWCMNGDSCSLPDQPCHVASITACTTSGGTCTDTGAFSPDGSYCPYLSGDWYTGFCSEGTCSACSWYQSCTPPDLQCWDGYVNCVSGAPVCQASGWKYNGAPCDSGLCQDGACVDAASVADLHGVWGDAPEDFWAVGEHGAIRRWDGASWPVIPSGTGASLFGVWGSSGSDVWAVGEAIILHWDGTSWSSVDGSGGATLHGVWGSGANSVWAVGTMGTILRWNGSTWAPVTSETGATLRAVSGTSATDVWVVGDGGTTLHWDGNAWANLTSVANPYVLYAVWAGTAADVFAGSENGLLRWDGSGWGWGGGDPCYTVWGSSPDDVWFWPLQHYGNNTWCSGGGMTFTFRAIWGSSSTDVWAVGDGGGTQRLELPSWCP